MLKRVTALTLALLLALSGPAYAGPTMTMQFAQGQQTATPVDDITTLHTLPATNVATSYTTPVIDVRAYNSYGLRLTAEGGTFLDTDMLSVTLVFYADAAATTALFIDQYAIFRTNIAGSLSPIKITDQMHGGWMTVAVSDRFSSPRDVDVAFTLVGSWRPLANTYLRTQETGMLYNRLAALAAAGVDSRAAELAYGRAMAVFSASGAGTMQIRLDGTGAGETVYELALAAAGRTTQEIVLPRIQSYVVLTNTSGAANSYRGRIIQQTEPN